jgi:hypothetical protein
MRATRCYKYIKECTRVPRYIAQYKSNVPALTMKVCRVTGGIASFLTSALDGGEWSTSFLGHFTPGEEPPYPMNRRLDGPQIWCGRFGGEKNILFRVYD